MKIKSTNGVCPNNGPWTVAVTTTYVVRRQLERISAYYRLYKSGVLAYKNRRCKKLLQLSYER